MYFTTPFDRVAITVAGMSPRRNCVFNVKRARYKPDDRPLYEQVISGFKLFRGECVRFIQEWKERFTYDMPQWYLNQIVPQYRFNKKQDIDFFEVVTDSDHNLGFSKAEFTPTRNGTAVFKGVLDTQVPKDGRTKYAGMAAIITYPKTKSFQREVYYDWGHWTHLVIRCRGDGRSYMINLTVFGDFDVHWYVVYSYPLYTRGGPYWQLTYIPFSKFYLVNKGRIQDKQNRVPLTRVRKIGVTLGDGNAGPFELEIDFIGCTIGELTPEEFAYEKYEAPKDYSVGF